MNCRAFRKDHIAFVDGRTPDETTAGMYDHLEQCERCGTFDMAIRRGLLVARNLPSILPSPDFERRLQARLRSEPWGANGPEFMPPRTIAGRALAAVRLGASMAVIAAGLAVMHNRQPPYARQPAATASPGVNSVVRPPLPPLPPLAVPPARRASVDIAMQVAGELVRGTPVWPDGLTANGRGERRIDSVVQTASLSP